MTHRHFSGYNTLRAYPYLFPEHTHDSICNEHVVNYSMAVEALVRTSYVVHNFRKNQTKLKQKVERESEKESEMRV